MISTKSCDFNPRSHEGSDGRTSFTFFFSGVFQSTLPRGERPGEVREVATLFKFQSTLPRGERRMPFNAYALVWNISIHAPTRGATKYSFSIFRYVYFNPRSHEGSDDTTGIEPVTCSLHFNPRSHEGSDEEYGLTVQLCMISIHAPTRGATFFQVFQLLFCLFQSTLPRGERP